LHCNVWRGPRPWANSRRGTAILGRRMSKGMRMLKSEKIHWGVEKKKDGDFPAWACEREKRLTGRAGFYEEW